MAATMSASTEIATKTEELPAVVSVEKEKLQEEVPVSTTQEETSNEVPSHQGESPAGPQCPNADDAVDETTKAPSEPVDITPVNADEVDVASATPVESKEASDSADNEVALANKKSENGATDKQQGEIASMVAAGKTTGDREVTPDSADNSEDLSPRETSPVDLEGVEEEIKSNGAVQKSKDKSKKKEDKSIEHILKALNSLQTSEEKLAALCKKYTDLLEEHRLLQSKFKQNQRKLTVILREKEQLQSEHSKAVLAKSKLESLCRELQRHNKLVKEESLARAREEEEKRKEVTAKFQATITDIQSQMNDHYAKNGKLREENIELANRLKNLIEQYELREKHIEKVLKHKDLEAQLVDAKLAQASLQMTEEMEKNLREKQQMMSQASDQEKKIQLLEGQEKQLKAQVALYTEKYEEFQSTLAKSNNVFQNFKQEMDKMTKKIKKLEKETSLWRTRWENSNKALLDMAEEKTRADKESALQQAKIVRLEKLCRALQAERHKATGSGGENAEMIGNLEAAVAADAAAPPPPPPPPATENSTLKVIEDIQTTKTPPNTPSESEENTVTDQQSVIQAASGQLEAAAAADQSQEALQNEGSPPVSQSEKEATEAPPAGDNEKEAAA